MFPLAHIMWLFPRHHDGYARNFLFRKAVWNLFSQDCNIWTAWPVTFSVWRNVICYLTCPLVIGLIKESVDISNCHGLASVSRFVVDKITAWRNISMTCLTRNWRFHLLSRIFLFNSLHFESIYSFTQRKQIADIDRAYLENISYPVAYTIQISTSVTIQVEDIIQI